MNRSILSYIANLSNHLLMAIFGCIFYVSPGYSFDENMSFSHITTEQGLSNFSVNTITQDWQGFMWFGTMEGLNRFDGNEMKTYLNIANDPNSLSDNQVFDIFSDYKNDLWIGTEYGICLYNRDRDNFHRFILDPNGTFQISANHISAIDESPDKELIIAVEAGQLYRLNRSINKFQLLSPEFGIIKDFLVDAEGKYWIGEEDGVTVYDPATSLSEKYDSYKLAGQSYPIRDVYTLFEEGDTLWIGTNTGNVFYFLKSENQMNVFDTSPMKCKFVSDISKNREGMLIFSTMSSLHFYDKRSGKFSSHRYEKGNSYGLNASGINTVFEDKQQNLWVGTQLGGVNLMSYSKKFRNYNEYSRGLTLLRTDISSLCEDSNGQLWLGSYRMNINIVDPVKKTSRMILYDQKDPGSIGEGSVFCIYCDSKGNIWTGTYRGYLQRYDSLTGKFISYPFSKDAPTKNRGEDVRSILEDGDGMLWICSHGNGLSQLNPQTGEYKHYQHDEENTENSLVHNYPYQVMQGNAGFFWIATPGGLSRFDRKAETFRNFYHQPGDLESLPDNDVNVLFEDSNYKLWVGTKNGLGLFDRKSESFKNYFMVDGLPNNNIKAILEHEPGELWIATNEGLSRLRYRELDNGKIEVVFRNYDESDNLQDRYFWDRSAVKTKDGTLVFGCKKGIIAFYPEEIQENSKEPEVLLTNFSLGKQTIYPGDGSILQEPLYKTQTITLSHNQNFFSFDFVAFNYISNKKNICKYKLEGYDPHWIEADGKRTATYSNVDPGQYVFRVIASNNDGVWNEVGASVKVVVKPPVTDTWWFRILMVLLIIGIIIYYVRNRVQNLRKRNVILEENVEERIKELSELNEEFKAQNDLLEEQKETSQKAFEELEMYKTKLEALVDERTSELIVEKEKAEAADQLKTSFLTNLSHEIRTPLNSIIGFSGLLFDQSITEEERLSYKQIIDSSNNSLLGLINDIIDFAKMESGDLKLIFKETVLDSIFEELQQIYTSEIKKQTNEGEKSLDFKIKIDERSRGLIIITDEVRVKQVLTILINNAVKFTNEGFIEVGSHLKDNRTLELYVRDTGIGIDEVHHKVIFERFRKIEEDNQQLFRGAGIGLSIARELSSRLGGELSLQSTLGKGSRFSFTIPLVSKDMRKRAKAAERQKTGIPELFGKKILIAEDDHSNFVYLQKLLLKTNAKVLHAINGKEVIKIWKDNPDLCLILMDIKMHELNGMDALLKLKELDISIPVIAQTAYAFDDEVRKIRETGFADYLTKPISAKELYSKLKSHLDIP